MIHNPPEISYLIRAWLLLSVLEFPAENITAAMAAEFRRKLGPMDWTAFQTVYHLYLQTIPFGVARAAWGINEARGFNRANPTPNQPAKTK